MNSTAKHEDDPADAEEAVLREVEWSQQPFAAADRHAQRDQARADDGSEEDAPRDPRGTHHLLGAGKVRHRQRWTTDTDLEVSTAMSASSYSVARGLMLRPRGPTAKERRLGRREHPRATELRRPAPAAGSHASAIPWGRSSALESKLDGCVDRQRTATSEQLIELGRGEASSAEQLERLRVAPLAPPRHVSSESLRQPA